GMDLICRLDIPDRNDTGIRAVWRNKRAADNVSLPVWICGLAGYLVVLRMVEQRGFQLRPVCLSEPTRQEELCLAAANRMRGIQQIFGDFRVVESGVCRVWQQAHTGRISSRSTVSIQWTGSANSTS